MANRKQFWALLPTEHRHQVRKGHSTPLCPFSDDPREIARILAASPSTFDIWSVEKRDGDIVAGRVVVAGYGGQGPEEWYPHKYTPKPSESLLVYRNVPVGELDSFKMFTKGLVKDVNMCRNEIEAALVESDLYVRHVDQAMDLLPDLKNFYAFLEEKGQRKTINLIKRLLSY